MANCGVKRDLESSYVHCRNSVKRAFSKMSIEVLHSSSCNRVFRTEFFFVSVSEELRFPGQKRFLIRSACV